jgi:hypothetical protein
MIFFRACSGTIVIRWDCFGSKPTRRNKVMSKIQGEGDYISGRAFQDAQHRFAEHGPVEQAAHDAADALSGPEAESLEAARLRAAKGRTKSEEAKRQASRQEHKLDRDLDDSFPASDPLPASRGAD